MLLSVMRVNDEWCDQNRTGKDGRQGMRTPHVTPMILKRATPQSSTFGQARGMSVIVPDHFFGFFFGAGFSGAVSSP